MNKSYDILIKNIKEKLWQKGWSQGTLGGKADVSQERISYVLNGKTEPTLSLMDKIADALDVSTVDLLSDEKINEAIIKEPLADDYTAPDEIVFTKYGKTSKVRNVNINIPSLGKFRTDFTNFNFDKNKSKSGKPNSYANYMEYLLQNYYDNFGEILNPFNKSTVSKLEELQKSHDFIRYNLNENRFPNAAIESYKRFMHSK
ncbi:helix-turn-helix domain-containing protein [Enterococcus alishanensis]